MLKAKNIEVGTHVAQMQEIMDEPFAQEEVASRHQLRALEDQYLACLSDSVREAIEQRIEQAQAQGDSMGGILESAVAGMPAGVGEPFSIRWKPAGASVVQHRRGQGRGIRRRVWVCQPERQSTANDGITIEQGHIRTLTNHNGGINGGITNGMPAGDPHRSKPTPSIYQPQASVNLKTGKTGNAADRRPA